LVIIIPDGRLTRRLGLQHGKKLTTPHQLLLAVVVDQEGVLADAFTALWQSVQQEAANELVGSERHGLSRGDRSDLKTDERSDHG
jgi:hypothetical protein